MSGNGLERDVLLTAKTAENLEIGFGAMFPAQVLSKALCPDLAIAAGPCGR